MQRSHPSSCVHVFVIKVRLFENQWPKFVLIESDNTPRYAFKLSFSTNVKNCAVFRPFYPGITSVFQKQLNYLKMPLEGCYVQRTISLQVSPVHVVSFLFNQILHCVHYASVNGCNHRGSCRALVL